MKKQYKNAYILLLIIFFFNIHGNNPNPSNLTQNTKKIILIGAGGNKGKTYFNLLKNSVDFVGFIHPNPKEDLLLLSQEYDIPVFSDIKQAADTINFDGAILAVPHHLHFDYTKELLELSKFVIKEKPISITSKELETFLRNGTPPLFVIVQRQFQSSFLYAQKQLSRIGKIYSFKYEYNLCLKEETSGWRAEKQKCFGGVLLDMGYHVIDIVNTFFGAPAHVSGKFAYKTNKMKQEGLEDEIFILASYPNGLVGNIIISRLGTHKREYFEIAGEKGIIKVDPRSCQIFDSSGHIIETYESPTSKTEEIVCMFETYLNQLNNKEYIENELRRHSENIKIIEDLYSLR